MPFKTEITADRWSPRGHAEGTLDGRPLRIWQGIPGERALVKVTHEGYNETFAHWVDARPFDPHRVEPRCRRYHLCGGCPFMHLDLEGQYAARRALVRDALAAEGLRHVEVGPVTPSPDGIDDFRYTVKLGVGVSDHGHLRVGAWGRGSRNVVPIPECHVAAPPLRELMPLIAHHVRELKLWPYEPDTDRGILRAIVLRGSRATREVLVTLVAGRRVPGLNDLAEALAADANVIGVALHLNSEPGNAIFQRDDEGAVRTMLLGGRGYVDEMLDGITYRIGPGDFFQTNPGMAEVLYRETLERLKLDAKTPFLDLYSGVGGFALSAARTAAFTVGVEEIEGAVLSARSAARRNDVSAEFVAARVVDALADLRPRVAGARPVVTINPARRGLEPGVVQGLLALNPRRIAYVSCNPRALARDLVVLEEGGMRADRVALYDMFPNTSHVECVVVLESKDRSAPTRRAPRRKVVG